MGTDVQPKLQKLSVNEIRTDGGTQPRVDVDDDFVRKYAEKMAEGIIFPPVVVFFDGRNYWLADGFHRKQACDYADVDEIDCHVYEGGRREAFLYAASANETHGKPRSDDDKRQIVTTMLKDEEWSTWSDSAISKTTDTSQTFVSKLRRQGAGKEAADPVAQSRPSASTATGASPGGDQDAPGQGTGTPGNAPPDDPPQNEFADDPPDQETPRPTDREGRPIPEWLLQLFDDTASRIASVQKQIQDVRRAVRNEIAGTEASRYLNHQQVDRGLKDAWNALKYCAPYAVCPVCEGPGCDSCKNAGYLPKPHYDSLDKSR